MVVMARQVKLEKDKLIFCGYDDWCRPVWKYKNTYLKDVTLKGSENNIPNILNDTADNTFDGEPNNKYEIIIV